MTDENIVSSDSEHRNKIFQEPPPHFQRSRTCRSQEKNPTGEFDEAAHAKWRGEAGTDREGRRDRFGERPHYSPDDRRNIAEHVSASTTKDKAIVRRTLEGNERICSESSFVRSDMENSREPRFFDGTKPTLRSCGSVHLSTLLNRIEYPGYPHASA